MTFVSYMGSEFRRVLSKLVFSSLKKVGDVPATDLAVFDRFLGTE